MSTCTIHLLSCIQSSPHYSTLVPCRRYMFRSVPGGRARRGGARVRLLGLVYAGLVVLVLGVQARLEVVQQRRGGRQQLAHHVVARQQQARGRPGARARATRRSCPRCPACCAWTRCRGTLVSRRRPLSGLSTFTSVRLLRHDFKTSLSTKEAVDMSLRISNTNRDPATPSLK